MLLETWIPFVLATLVFAFMPGPAILYMSAQTLAYGQRAGLMAALGIHLGCYVHIAAASAGLAALLHHAPVLYSFLRLAGAFYMLWLGGRMMFASVANEATEISSRHRRVLRDSIVVEILNPKTALFFLTFLPQFVDPQRAMPGWLQFLLLGIIVNGAFSLGDLASVAIASFAAPRIASSGFADWIPKVSGGVLVGLSAALMVHFI
ncbi:amino acid transporter [Ochrobactrum sp. POC9]|uniref:LysE family translocator n=1 Tax=unclassified Ochrobactrum TaxID=239106 RepID=UPI000D7069FB|nr:LysE family translocator [Ochrobactrum sp. POC9]MCH4543355.1 LysE family translocator [Ochrobactrum sp. A-1]PWU71001.1 amino acid transporter [Ochrobactrum sp. POC9]